MGLSWRVIGIVAAALIYGAPSAVADAVPGVTSARSMITGSVTSQPIGHYDFCKRYPDDCRAHASDIRPPVVTDHGWEIVHQVNSTVNVSIVPETDADLYGKDEYWTYPTTAGDCEDYVLLKRYMLMERGFKASDLLITVVRKPDGEGHAVLTLRTAEGDYILDNLVAEVKLWTKTPYTYLKRQAIDNSGRWVTIENGSELLVGAVR
ncbi:MAG: transglutaminase-like cysteine peptidase [Pararhizobium sp.]